MTAAVELFQLQGGFVYYCYSWRRELPVLVSSREVLIYPNEVNRLFEGILGLCTCARSSMMIRACIQELYPIFYFLGGASVVRLYMYTCR